MIGFVLAQRLNCAFFLIGFFLLLPSEVLGVSRILLYGDSLSAGFGLSAKQGFAAQLERALTARGLEVKIDNASQSGETSRGGLARLPWVLEHYPKPDLVILELGANDALRALSPRKARANLDRMIALFRAKRIKILLAGMLAPANLGKPYGDAFNKIYPDLTKRYGLLLFPFFLKDVANVKALNLDDGIHPNAVGVERIVSNIVPFVVKGLEKTRRLEGQ